MQAKAAIASALERSVWPLVEACKVLPVVHEVFPLTQAAEAHRALELGAHVGKIVMVTDSR